MNAPRVPRFLALLLLILPGAALSCGRGGPVAGPVSIEATPGASPSGNVIHVKGLSGAELRALAGASLDTPAWQALLRVGVSESEAIPIAGQYVVTDSALEFQPQFPFDLGRSYAVRFDPARLPTPRREPTASARIRFAAPPRTPSTSVASLYPSGAVWPENMLRFYVHFSAPMSRNAGVKFVHLLDDAGREVPDAILAAYADLWNTDGTRLTVFFDPGRVKRGVGPNAKLGRAIVQARRYAIAIDAEWPDAQGQPLTAPFRREFTAGAAAYDALEVSDWRLTTPKAGTTAPLAVVFPAALDRALLERSIGVRTDDGRDLPGRIATGATETAWTFVPTASWKAGRYELAVMTILEDPAGNSIGRPFEVLPSAVPQATPPEITTLPFEIQ